ATDDRTRLQLLGRVTEAMAKNLEYTGAMHSLAEILVRELADWGFVAVVNERARFEGLHIAVADPDLRDVARELEAEDPSWLTRSPRAQAVLAEETSAFPEPFRIEFGELPARTTPRQLELLTALGLGTALVIPLRARGRVTGMIVLVLREGRFSREQVITAAHVAHRAGLGLDNVRLYERERAAALTLQRRLLPEVPELAGLDIAATYLPAQHP
ncbi:MAG TPA: GAF domain-containing protein, partial [Actinotalea sp.]|nr:GAF domain-containing protein [Actinotalea sp.]